MIRWKEHTVGTMAIVMFQFAGHLAMAGDEKVGQLSKVQLES